MHYHYYYNKNFWISKMIFESCQELSHVSKTELLLLNLIKDFKIDSLFGVL